jgi:ABC-type cobalamin/Fe3+-siderophores transport system ATPase subunit
LLILDEPTRGIDVGAKFEIAALVEEMCQKGMALLFISSELEEVARLSHRVLVLRDRVVIGELAGAEVSEHNILAMIAGTAQAAQISPSSGTPGEGRGGGLSWSSRPKPNPHPNPPPAYRERGSEDQPGDGGHHV